MAHVQRITEVRATDDDEVRAPLFLARLIYLIVGIVEAFIVLRIFLLLLGANTGSAFVDAVYGISDIFVAPFYGIFGYTPTFGASVFDLSSLVALLVYALIGWALVYVVSIGSRRTDEV